LAPGLSEKIKAARFKPSLLLMEMGHWVQSVREQGGLDSIRQQALDSSLTSLTDYLGGCERIANTPLPYSYSVLLHRTVYVYCFLLPLGLVDSLGRMTP